MSNSPLDWEAYRARARASTQGMNNAPFVFSDWGSLNGMTPEQARQALYPRYRSGQAVNPFVADQAGQTVNGPGSMENYDPQTKLALYGTDEDRAYHASVNPLFANLGVKSSDTASGGLFKGLGQDYVGPYGTYGNRR